MSIGDVIGLKRTIEQLEQVASEMPTIERYLHFARGGYHLLRGDAESAARLFQQSLAGTSPREFIGWTAVMGFLAAAYNAQGRFERAREAALQATAQLEEADRAFPAANLRVFIELSLAEAAMGESERAGERLETLIKEHAAGEGPATLGSLHQARARIALGARQRA
jgi:tetratricopeptide (TPR) repeat protein